MKIAKTALDMINKAITGEPPETGGILGSTSNETIDAVIIDVPTMPVERHCSYSPNVDFLNENIQIWSDKEISFKGIFHTHFVGIKTLSDADKKYIRAIMTAMPENINSLFFPVFVLPDRELVCYKAERKDRFTDIYLDELTIES